MSEEIIQYNTSELVYNDNHINPMSLIEYAVKNNTSIDKLEQLMDLYERWELNQAKKSFKKALAEFQSECPPIPKTGKVKFTSKGAEVSYKFAQLDVMADIIKPYLKKVGLSYRWEFYEKDNMIGVKCIISHIDGYSESTSMTANIDFSGSKNEIQSRGSTITYLQRYTLKAALGIATSDEDIDGISEDEETMFDRYILNYDIKDHLENKFKEIKSKDVFYKFFNDLPTISQVERFKSLLDKVEHPDKEKVIIKLWDGFQKQYKDTADNWLNNLEQSNLIRKDK